MGLTTAQPRFTVKKFPLPGDSSEGPAHADLECTTTKSDRPGTTSLCLQVTNNQVQADPKWYARLLAAEFYKAKKLELPPDPTSQSQEGSSQPIKNKKDKPAAPHSKRMRKMADAILDGTPFSKLLVESDDDEMEDDDKENAEPTPEAFPTPAIEPSSDGLLTFDTDSLELTLVNVKPPFPYYLAQRSCEALDDILASGAASPPSLPYAGPRPLECNIRAAYSAVLPELLVNRGWEETVSGALIEPTDEEFPDHPRARYEDANALVTAGEIPVDLLPAFSTVRAMVYSGSIAAKGMGLRRKKKAGGRVVTATLLGSPAKKRGGGGVNYCEENGGDDMFLIMDEEEEEGEEKEEEEEGVEKGGGEEKAKDMSWRKYSRVGDTYQVAEYPSVGGTFATVLPDDEAPGYSLTWDPALAAATADGGSAVAYFLQNSVPSRCQDQAMSLIHRNGYEISASTAAVVKMMNAAPKPPPTAPRSPARSPKKEKPQSAEEVGVEDGGGANEKAADLTLWPQHERSRFHELIMQHFKDLRKVANDMEGKTMGDVLQYYLSVYKQSRSYHVLKALMTAKRMKDAIDDSDDNCAICGEDGDLICCETCPRVYHAGCLLGGGHACENELRQPTYTCMACADVTVGKILGGMMAGEEEEKKRAMETEVGDMFYRFAKRRRLAINDWKEEGGKGEEGGGGGGGG